MLQSSGVTPLDILSVLVELAVCLQVLIERLRTKTPSSPGCISLHDALFDLGHRTAP